MQPLSRVTFQCTPMYIRWLPVLRYTYPLEFLWSEVGKCSHCNMIAISIAVGFMCWCGRIVKVYRRRLSWWLELDTHLGFNFCHIANWLRYWKHLFICLQWNKVCGRTRARRYQKQRTDSFHNCHKYGETAAYSTVPLCVSTPQFGNIGQHITSRPINLPMCGRQWASPFWVTIQGLLNWPSTYSMTHYETELDVTVLCGSTDNWVRTLPAV